MYEIKAGNGIIEKEMNGSAAFAQIQKATTVTQALAVMVEAQSISVADGKKPTPMTRILVLQTCHVWREGKHRIGQHPLLRAARHQI